MYYYNEALDYTAEEYVEMFKQIMLSNMPIYDRDGKQLFIKEDETFKQCYKADDSVRKSLPKSWFISEYGTVIDIIDPTKPKWKKKYRKENSKSYCYKYPYEIENGHITYKNIELHNLAAIVWGSYRFGRAKRLLEEKGVQAFGIKRKGIIAVNGHHKDGNKENNHYTNTEMVSTPVHTHLDRAPKTDDEEQNIKFLVETSALMDEENPDGATVIVADGISKEIYEIPEDSPFLKQLDEFLRTHIFIAKPMGKEAEEEE